MDTARPAGRRLATVVRLLDWTGRFRIVTGETARLRLDDRPGPDGSPTVRHGGRALIMILSRLPLTFWFTAPLLPFIERDSGETR